MFNTQPCAIGGEKLPSAMRCDLDSAGQPDRTPGQLLLAPWDVDNPNR